MKLNKPREWYYYHNMVNAPDADIRKEYTRIRKAFNKALQSGFGAYERQVSGRNITPYPIMKGLEMRDIKHYLAEMVNLSFSKGFTDKGRRVIRREAIETLRARGIKSVNTKNWMDFIRFASHYYDAYGIKYTDEAIQAFDAVLKRGGDMDALMRNIEYYQNHVDELKAIPVKGKNTKQMLKAFELKADKDIDYD